MDSIAAERKAEEEEDNKADAYRHMGTIITADDFKTPHMVELARLAYKEMQKKGFDLPNFDLPPRRVLSIQKMLKEKKKVPWGHDNPDRTPEKDAIFQAVLKETGKNSVEVANAYAAAKPSDPYHKTKWMALMVAACGATHDECRNQRNLAVRSAYAKFLAAGDTLEEYFDRETIEDMLWTLIPYTRK